MVEVEKMEKNMNGVMREDSSVRGTLDSLQWGRKGERDGGRKERDREARVFLQI